MTRRLGLALALLSLLGCAGAGPAIRPADLPFHAVQPPIVTLHWRVDRPDGAVTASGVAELSAPDRLEWIVLALEGVDRDGRVLSTATTRIGPRAFTGDVAWPFEVRLRPTGTEERFLVRVAEWSWRVARGGR